MPLATSVDAPRLTEPPHLRRRRTVAALYLSGDGLEIGALNAPLDVPPGARVTYVDRMSVEDLRLQYPELANQELTDVDVVDDGERLRKIAPVSQDFIIANHFLEHTQDPIGTMKRHLEVLRPGGVFYMAVPNRHDTFDRDRPPTSWEHLRRDHLDGPQWSYEIHLREFAELVDKRNGAALEQRIDELRESQYSIHYHVWNESEFRTILDRAADEFELPFNVEYCEYGNGEILAILRKTSFARRSIRSTNDDARLNEVLRELIRDQERDHRNKDQSLYLLHSFAASLQASFGWRLLGPLRLIKHWLRPRGFDQSHLLPWNQLDPIPGEPGGWQVRGSNPQFLVACWLPAGWIRIRLRIHSSIKSRMEIYAETSDTFTADSRIGEIVIAKGDNDEEFYFKLPRPTKALRIHPFNAAGTIRIDRFEVTPRPKLHAVIDALRRKLRLLRAYRNTVPVLARGLKLLATGQWQTVARKWALGLDDPRYVRFGFYEPDKAYEHWIEKHKLTDADRAAYREWAAKQSNPPLISLLLPTFNTPECYLRLALDSVVRQTYPHWELCVADDGSTEPHVRRILEEYAASDKRIRLAPAGRHGGISEATNAALAMACGEFVALFDHDDEIAEHALYAMARVAVEQPYGDVIYSDEDKIQPDGKRVNPFFKPDWSPEFFLSCMFTCHLSLYRTALVREAGGFDSAYDGAQDYDLALRVIEKARRVVHVPDVLYHWRLLPNSTASGVTAKPHAPASGLRALDAHLLRTGREGRAEIGPSPGLNFVRFDVVGTPKISIIIPTLGASNSAPGRDIGYIENCVASIKKVSTWKKFEIILLDRHTMPDDVYGRLRAGNVKRVTYDSAFNWSAVNNLGARHATGDLLLFLNDDIEVLTPDWLESLLEYAQQKEIGAVGGKLLFPDGGLQHVGVTVLDGKPGHPFYGYPKHHTGYYCRNVLPHNCSAVTGACLMTRADVFREMGGFDESFPLNYNDVDYCLRLRQAGYRIVFTPHAVLTHYEGATKAGVFAEELRAFQTKWGEHVGDPYYNPNLNTETFDYRIA
jgi:GT2 family glycosyltransferase/predicted SAM-dependent methyltransferase